MQLTAGDWNCWRWNSRYEGLLSLTKFLSWPVEITKLDRFKVSKGKKRQQEFYNETIFWKQRNVKISPNKSEEKSLLAGMPIKLQKKTFQINWLKLERNNKSKEDRKQKMPVSNLHNVQVQEKSNYCRCDNNHYLVALGGVIIAQKLLERGVCKRSGQWTYINLTQLHK